MASYPVVMMSPANFAAGLASQVAASWSSLPSSACGLIQSVTAVQLPEPYDRISLECQRRLEAELAQSPNNVYQVAAVLGLSTDLVKEGLGDRFEPFCHEIVSTGARLILEDVSSKEPQVPAAFQEIHGRTGEKEMIGRLMGLDSGQLNGLLWVMHRQDRLHGFLNDFRSGFFLWSNKKALVKLLTRDRLSELTIPVRAALVFAMQKGITGRVMEEGIANVLTGTNGPDLTRLKAIIDQRSPQDMVELTHHDVNSKRLRKKILAHVGREASGLTTRIPIILSDIDDTVYCNWKDKRYPKKTVYPGMHAFYRALGRFEANDWERRGPVFVSARPEEGFGIVEGYTVGTLQGIGFSAPTVLSGDLLHLVGAAIAVKKLENCALFDALFPEFSKVFVGDNGQQDVDVGRDLLRTHADRMLAVFIQDVQETASRKDEGFLREVVSTPAGDRDIFYFDTYIGAALAASRMEKPLLQAEDVSGVAREVVSEFRKIEFESKEQREKVRRLLQHDLDLTR